MDKFIPSTDSSIIDRMLEEGEPIPVLGYDEYLNLPTIEQYENNAARIARMEKGKAGIWELCVEKLCTI